MRRLHFASRLTSCRPPIFHPRASRKYTSTLARTNTLAASHCILTSRQKSICFSKSYMCLFFFCVAHRHYFVKSGSRKAMLPHTTLPRRATRKSHTVTIYAWREWGMLMRHSGEPLRFISIFFFSYIRWVSPPGTLSTWQVDGNCKIRERDEVFARWCSSTVVCHWMVYLVICLQADSVNRRACSTLGANTGEWWWCDSRAHRWCAVRWQCQRDSRFAGVEFVCLHSRSPITSL